MSQKEIEMEQEIKQLKEELQKQKEQEAATSFYRKPEKLRNYNGDEDVLEWINDCKVAFSISQTEAEKTKFVLGHLEGTAKQEVRLQKDPTNTTAIFDILEEAFGGSKVYSEAQRNFFSRTQKPGESMRKFSLELSELMERIKHIKVMGNEDEILRDTFIAGIREQTLRRKLKLKVEDDPTLTFMKCRKIAIDWTEDKGQEEVFEPQINKIRTSEIAELKAMVQNLTAMNNPYQTTPYQDGPRCWGCNQQGHKLQSCWHVSLNSVEPYPSQTHPHFTVPRLQAQPSSEHSGNEYPE